MANIDEKTVNGFGEEWSEFTQDKLTDEQARDMFNKYFSLFDWDSLPGNAEGFDLGCGSGRWARLVAPKVGKLYCIDASEQALDVAKSNLQDQRNCEFIHASVDELPLENESMEFAYSLGVLHHIPDTLSGIKSCVDKLKLGAPFLVYLYYAFDNRPLWFRMVWKISDMLRGVVSRLPFKLKLIVSNLIALLIYFPLARVSLLLEKSGIDVENIPLSAYRKMPFYMMRTDSLDRFGTRLESRFTKAEIRQMLEDAGLEQIKFRDGVPYWCAVGVKKLREMTKTNIKGIMVL